jgi:hypothetical protein
LVGNGDDFTHNYWLCELIVGLFHGLIVQRGTPRKYSGTKRFTVSRAAKLCTRTL